MAQVKQILGIDYGKEKIGLAISDTETRIAFVFGVLKNDKNFFDNISNIIKREDVESIVVGIPSYINKEEIEYPGEKIGKIIEEKFGLKVFYQDEMFTTKMAKKNLIEKGIKGVDKFDDGEAARIILQSWLDKN